MARCKTPSREPHDGTQRAFRRQICATTLRVLQVVVLAALVHVCIGPILTFARAEQDLPRHVADLRDALLATARSGRIDDLYAVIDMSPTEPDVGNAKGTDAVAHLRATSSDGHGYDELAALAEILAMPPAVLPFGRDLENNLIYVWPYLAERPLDSLTASESVDLYRLVGADKVAEMQKKKLWTWWRLAITADGSWVSFKKSE